MNYDHWDGEPRYDLPTRWEWTPPADESIWRTAAGTDVPIEHMSTSHLINVAAMLYRFVAHVVMGVPIVCRNGATLDPAMDVESMRRRYANMVAELNRRKRREGR